MQMFTLTTQSVTPTAITMMMTGKNGTKD